MSANQLSIIDGLLIKWHKAKTPLESNLQGAFYDETGNLRAEVSFKQFAARSGS